MVKQITHTEIISKDLPIWWLYFIITDMEFIGMKEVTVCSVSDK